MNYSDLVAQVSEKANQTVVSARYKKSYQNKYGQDSQWGIIQGDSLLLIDKKGREHGIAPLSRFVKASIKEVNQEDILNP